MSTPRPIRIVTGILLAFILLLAFTIQSAFATSAVVPGNLKATPTPASTREACEDNGGELIQIAPHEHDCVYFPPYRPYGQIGASTNGNHSKDDLSRQESILRLSGERDIYAIFPFASCPQQCTISATLPRAAANDLADSALPRVSVRLVELGGAPGTNVYWVCFENQRFSDPAVYRYLEGAWARITFERSTDPFCTFVSSGGSFYLGDG